MSNKERFIAYLDGVVIVDEPIGNDQTRIQSICQEYDVVLKGNTLHRRTYYKGFREVTEHIHKYTFKRRKKA